MEHILFAICLILVTHFKCNIQETSRRTTVCFLFLFFVFCSKQMLQDIMSKTQAKSGVCLPSLLFVSQVWCECTSEGFKLKGCTCAMIQPESKTIFLGNQDHASIRTMPPSSTKHTSYFTMSLKSWKTLRSSVRHHFCALDIMHRRVRPGASHLRLSRQNEYLLFPSFRQGTHKKAPEVQTESERNRLLSHQGQPAATVNEPLQTVSPQSTESLPIINVSSIMPTLSCT